MSRVGGGEKRRGEEQKKRGETLRGLGWK